MGRYILGGTARKGGRMFRFFFIVTVVQISFLLLLMNCDAGFYYNLNTIMSWDFYYLSLVFMLYYMVSLLVCLILACVLGMGSM